MLPYFLYFTIVILFFILANVIKCFRKDGKLLISPFFIIAVVIFWGARSEHVGTDTLSVYKPWFTSDFAYLSHLHNFSKEIGFVLYSIIIKYISNENYRIYMISVVLLVTVLWFYVFRKNGPFFIAGFSYFITQHFFITSCVNIFRQGIAMSFVAIGIVFLFYNKKSKFYLFLIIAILFHYSALIALIFPLFAKYRITTSKLIITIVILFFIFILSTSTNFVTNIYTNILYFLPLPDVIKWRAKNYLEYENSAVISVGFFFSTIITLTLIVFRDKISKINEIKGRILINGMIFYLFINIILSFNEVLFRLSMYFYIIEFLSIPVILHIFFQIFSKYRVLVLTFFVLFLSLASIKTIISLNDTPFMASYFE